MARLLALTAFGGLLALLSAAGAAGPAPGTPSLDTPPMNTTRDCLELFFQMMDGLCADATPWSCPGQCQEGLVWAQDWVDSSLEANPEALNKTQCLLDVYGQYNPDRISLDFFVATITKCGVNASLLSGPDQECSGSVLALLTDESHACFNTTPITECPKGCQEALAELEVGQGCYDGVLSILQPGAATQIGAVLRKCKVAVDATAEEACIDEFMRLTEVSPQSPCGVTDSTTTKCNAKCQAALSGIAWTPGCWDGLQGFFELNGVADLLRECKVERPSAGGSTDDGSGAIGDPLTDFVSAILGGGGAGGSEEQDPLGGLLDGLMG